MARIREWTFTERVVGIPRAIKSNVREHDQRPSPALWKEALLPRRLKPEKMELGVGRHWEQSINQQWASITHPIYSLQPITKVQVPYTNILYNSGHIQLSSFPIRHHSEEKQEIQIHTAKERHYHQS
jgi:hypothetical protein